MALGATRCRLQRRRGVGHLSVTCVLVKVLVGMNEVTCSWFYRLTDILSGGPDATENLWLYLLLE